METSQAIRLVFREPSLLHHPWKGFGRPRVSARHLLHYQLHSSITSHLNIWLAFHRNAEMQRLPLIEVREDVRKYREHALQCWAFFCYEGAPGGKVDEDCIFRVRLQQSTDYVVVFQPVLSEYCSRWVGCMTNQSEHFQRTTYWLDFFFWQQVCIFKKKDQIL